MFDFEGIFRSVLWTISYLVLKCVDHVYNIINSLFGLNLQHFPWIWSFFRAFTGIAVLVIFVRIGIFWFKSFWDDTVIDKLGGIDLLKRIVSVMLILSLLPIVMPAFSEMAADAATQFPNFVSVNIQPSDVIIDSGMADLKGDMSTSGVITIANGDHAVDVITTDNINEKTNGEYIYIPDTTNLLLICLLASFTAYCFIFVAVQIVQRLLGLLIKVLMAPVAVAGLIDPNDNGTSVWFRLCMADFLTAFFQMVLIWVAMLFCSSLPASFGGLTKGVVFIGAICSIMVAPNGIAEILGGDIGSQSGMQSMQQMMAFTGAANSALRITGAAARTAGTLAYTAGSKAVSTGKSGAAAATYGIGQALGGRSLNPGGTSSGTAESVVNGINGFGGNPLFGSESKGGVAESTVSYTAGNSSSSNQNGSVLSSSGIVAKDGTSGFKGADGIAHFEDGSVTENGSLADRFANKTSSAAAMASVFAKHRYTNAAQRVYSTPESRAKAKANRTMGDRLHTARKNADDYRKAIEAVRQKRSAS